MKQVTAPLEFRVICQAIMDGQFVPRNLNFLKNEEILEGELQYSPV